MSEARDFCNLLYQIAESRNGQDVMLPLGGIDVLVVQDRDSAQHILRKNAANYDKNMVWFRQISGPSRFTENGESWQFRQRLSTSYLSRFDRERAFEFARRRAEAAVEELLIDSDNGAAAMRDSVLRHMAGAVMLETFFDVSIEHTGVELEDIAKLLSFSSEYSFVAERSVIPFERNVLRTFSDLRAKILSNMSYFRSCDLTAQGFLSGLRDADEAHTHGFVLEHEMTMFFAAASETTASALGWVCFLLARNPAIQAELRELVVDFWAGEQSWVRLKELTLLENFILEALRMFPAIPAIARRAVKPDALNSREIAAGEQVLISVVGLQHDQRFCADPWRVDIRRDQRAVANNGQSMSFAIGPRMCAGSRFALVELMTMVSVFLRDAAFEPTTSEPPRLVFQTQLMHEGGQPVRLRRSPDVSR